MRYVFAEIFFDFFGNDEDDTIMTQKILKLPNFKRMQCHSPLPDWIADAGELALGVDMGAPQDSRRGILAINSNSN